ncbi:response regulator [Panacibacter sp. DH6]|uniref:Response regulator n=1 Tax=Panacibacter microcysteis TaxID=2793269 RepID=A0A931E7I2_9BACT|nr:response regulator [Panacibacter microcysteis]MBG9376836.1 response regulator [Panacibacter microcysteis]
MNKLVHIIEDDTTTLMVLKQYISKHGYQVNADYNGDGLDLEAPPPMLYLIDVNLKGKNGIDICKQIKELQPETPAIIISANKEVGAFISVCNANGFLPKPLDIDEVLATIDRFAHN